MKKLLLGFCLLLVMIAGTGYLALKAVNVSQYRTKTANFLSQKLGRNVTLNGPIMMELTEKGIVFDIQKVAIGNPDWANRPDLASLGHFKLIVQALPLLHHHLVIIGMTIEDADILLETTGDGKRNWDMAATPEPVSTKPEKAPGKSAIPVAISMHQMSITNSKIAIRDPDGNMALFKSDETTLARDGDVTTVNFNGLLNNVPASIALTTNNDPLTSKEPRPFDVDARFSLLRLIASGKISLDDQRAILETYNLSAKDSFLQGKMAFDWSHGVPEIIGAANSTHFDPKDFILNAQIATSPTATGHPPHPAAKSPFLLSDAPLDFSVLRSFNAEVTVNIADLPLEMAHLNKVDTRLALVDGRLFLSPFSAELGKGKLNGQLNIDAARATPHIGLTLNSIDIDLSDLFHLWGMGVMLTGKINTGLNVVSNGNSLHALASNLSGSFAVVGAGGDVITRTSDEISSKLEKLLNGGRRSDQTLNCLVARFTASQGIVRDNGILLDTSAATVAGSGGFDLRHELIDLIFRAKPKTVSIGNFLPPLEIDGTFLAPDYHIRTGAIVANIAGLVDGDFPSDPIPDVVSVQGQNACLSTLNKPSSAAQSGTAPTGLLIQDLENGASKLLKGFFGQ